RAGPPPRDPGRRFRLGTFLGKDPRRARGARRPRREGIPEKPRSNAGGPMGVGRDDPCLWEPVRPGEPSNAWRNPPPQVPVARWVTLSTNLGLTPQARAMPPPCGGWRGLAGSTLTRRFPGDRLFRAADTVAARRWLAAGRPARWSRRSL